LFPFARAIRLGADKAYDAEDFVNELRATKVTPRAAQNTNGCASAIDARTTRASLDVEYGPTSIAFTWIGSDEMDEVSGEGKPNCSKTASSRSNSNTTMATRPSSKRLGKVFQQPARS
jgi:hypothetical protein